MRLMKAHMHLTDLLMLFLKRHYIFLLPSVSGNHFSGQTRRSFWWKLDSLTQQGSLFSRNKNKEDLSWVSFNYKPEGRGKGGVISVSQYDVCDLALPGGVAVLLLNDNCTFPVAVVEIWQFCTPGLWEFSKKLIGSFFCDNPFTIPRISLWYDPGLNVKSVLAVWLFHSGGNVMHLKCIWDPIFSLGAYVMQGGEWQLPLELFITLCSGANEGNGSQEGTWQSFL